MKNESTEEIWDEEPIRIEDEPSNPIHPVVLPRPRDYLPIGFQHWNRYKGSHVGFKQYCKIMRRVIPAMTPEERVARLKDLTELDPSLNSNLDQRKLEFTINLLTPPQ